VSNTEFAADPDRGLSGRIAVARPATALGPGVLAHEGADLEVGPSDTWVTLFAVKRLLVVVLLGLAVSPITAPFSVQDIVALPGVITSVQAKKANDDLQPALAASPVTMVAGPDWIGDTTARRPVRPHLGRSLSLPLRL
jgi:hypothetical protein